MVNRQTTARQYLGSDHYLDVAPDYSKPPYRMTAFSLAIIGRKRAINQVVSDYNSRLPLNGSKLSFLSASWWQKSWSLRQERPSCRDPGCLAFAECLETMQTTGPGRGEQMSLLSGTQGRAAGPEDSMLLGGRHGEKVTWRQRWS